MILMNMSNVYFMKLMIMMTTTICFKNKHDDYNDNYPFIVWNDDYDENYQLYIVKMLLMRIMIVICRS